jgi:imidazolonepropionase-like amidohydrolase
MSGPQPASPGALRPEPARVYAADLLLPGDGTALRNAAVLVEDGRIARIGTRPEVMAQAQVPVLECGPATILAGLIDVHVHLVFDAGPDPVGHLAAVDDAALLLEMAGRARRLLDAGVTTVRDLGDRSHLAVRLREAIAAGHLPGPRILTAGAPLTPTGGHCWFLGNEADGVGAVTAAVRRNLREGADLTKVMVTGGTMTVGGPPPHRLQFSPDELRATVTETARFGRRVAAHVHGIDGVEAALDAGVHTLEHCSFATAGSPAAPARRAALIDRIAASGTYVCPTFSAVLTAVQEQRGPEVLRPWLDLVREQDRAGVLLVAGTDAGIQDAPFDRYAEGLLWYHRAGLAPETVLEMATGRAADALGTADRTGRLRPGLDADLIVVPGDPRTDLGVLADPVLVVARGRPHRPTSAITGPVPVSVRPDSEVRA